LLVEKTWLTLPTHYSHLRLDAFCLMPDHLHGILQICETPDKDKPLSEILRAFKTFTARRINLLRKTPGQIVWQRNYYERIIRNEHEMAALRDYILNNPFGQEGDLD
jgi:REP element-mobilizing transposase RayT